MDKFWKRAEQIFKTQLDNKKTIWGGYAISFICIAIGILLMCLIAFRHQKFSMQTMETPIASLIWGIMGCVFCFFRKSVSIRIKYYTACLVMASFSAYVLILHPEATSARFPDPNFNRAIDFAGIVFFGCAGCWVLYNDCMWYLKHKKKNYKSRKVKRKEAQPCGVAKPGVSQKIKFV